MGGDEEAIRAAERQRMEDLKRSVAEEQERIRREQQEGRR